MSARERLLVGLRNVRVRGDGRAPRGAAVGDRERLPVGRGGAVKGHETIVRALIELGADVNKARYSGATPLKWATRR